MKDNIKNIIINGIKNNYQEYVKSRSLLFEIVNKRLIGKKRYSFKTRQHCIYTEELFNKELELYKTNLEFTLRLKNYPDDSLLLIKINNPLNPSNEEIEKIYSSFNIEYRDKLIELKPFYISESYSSCYPVFLEPYNSLFWKSYNDYINIKQNSCDMANYYD